MERRGREQREGGHPSAARAQRRDQRRPGEHRRRAPDPDERVRARPRGPRQGRRGGNAGPAQPPRQRGALRRPRAPPPTAAAGRAAAPRRPRRRAARRAARVVRGCRRESGAADVPYAVAAGEQRAPRVRLGVAHRRARVERTRQPASCRRQTRSTSSPWRRPASKPSPRARRRTTSAAVGTYGTRPPGTTALPRPPMSSGERASAYRVQRRRAPPHGLRRTRGATAPTSGSAKCAAVVASQPGSGAQSLSRKATSAVATPARAALRAAAGPPLGSRRSTVAPCRRATARTLAGSADPSSTTTTGDAGADRREAAVERRGRSRTGTTTVTSVEARRGRRPGVREARVDEAPAERARGLAVRRPRRAAPRRPRAPAGVSRSARSGAPPTSTRPSR